MAKSALDSIIGNIKNSINPGYKNVQAWGQTFGLKLPEVNRIKSPVPANAPMAKNVSGPPLTNKFGLKGIAAIKAGPSPRPEATMAPKRQAMEDFGRYVRVVQKPAGVKVTALAKREPSPSPIPLKKKAQASPTPFATPTPPRKTQESSINPQYAQFLEKSIFPITRKYNIPDAVAAAQWAMEGGRVTQNAQNNPWGLMAGGKLLQYPSMEASTNDYALTVKNILDKKGYNVSDTDAFNVLLALQQGAAPRYEAHNENPYTYVENLINTPEWRSYYR